MERRRLAAIVAVIGLVVVVAAPVLAAKPAGSGKPDKSHAEGTEVTLHGTVESSTNGEGETAYTLTDGGTTYTLEAGPPWFFGDNYPLKPFVGKSVTIVGEKAADSNNVDVLSVDGTALREPGKPPWAGGWKRVGSLHPGWSQEKADRFKTKFGDCWPPGWCKDKNKAPEASEAP